MGFNPERFIELSAQLSREGEREQAREELADFLASVSDLYEWSLKGKIEDALAHIPMEQRQSFASELALIAEEVGWENAHKILSGELNLDREIERAVELRPDVKLYSHTVRRPDGIKHFKDFFKPEGGPVHYWIPRKFDIRRYVRIAQLAHEKSGRTGPVCLLDVGGGSGFLGKLIADEARMQGLDIEVTVVDPDEKIVAEAKNTFADTVNLKFDVDTAQGALSKYGPELSQAQRKHFDDLENQRQDLIEKGKEEIAQIRAILTALEGVDTPSDILKGPYGQRTERVLRIAGVDISKADTAEQICDALADYYTARREALQEKIQHIRDEQERLYESAGMQQAKVDVVLNSWMPLGLDFTRELRCLNAPAIIYARERGGATGVDYASDSPADLGKESSYKLGKFYYQDDGLCWEGVASGAVRSRTEYWGGSANVSEIVLRKGIHISKNELGKPPPDKDKYHWEKSLEELIGRERVEDQEFY